MELYLKPPTELKLTGNATDCLCHSCVNNVLNRRDVLYIIYAICASRDRHTVTQHAACSYELVELRIKKTHYLLYPSSLLCNKNEQNIADFAGLKAHQAK